MEAAESTGATTTGRATAGKTWDALAPRELRQKRRERTGHRERSRLSKIIATAARPLLKNWQT
eukprot:3508079-Pyramimonas_sp.AAC.1